VLSERAEVKPYKQTRHFGIFNYDEEYLDYRWSVTRGYIHLVSIAPTAFKSRELVSPTIAYCVDCDTD
jgi:hypothetical protein